MDEQLITSTSNPFVKRIRALAQRKHREAEKAFFVEGIRPVWQAVESGAGVEALIVAPDMLKSEAAWRMIREQRAAGTRALNVSGAVFASIAHRENPSGLGAIVRFTPRTLEELVITTRSFFVALQEVGNPGNLGTIIRTVDAVGGSGLILVGASTDPCNPTAVKASMGALFTVPIVHAANFQEVWQWSLTHGIKIITTSPRASPLYSEVEYPRPALFVFGSEGGGLSEPEWEQADMTVRIPMKGSADSLNLAVSVGVILYEVIRQESRPGPAKT